MKVYQITPDMDSKVVQSVLDEQIEYIYLPCKTEDDIIKNCKDANVLVSIYEPVTPKVIDALPDLKYLCIGSIGFDNVDVDYAKKKGILVSNNPSYCTQEVAQHVLALILNFNRKIFKFNQLVKDESKWDYSYFGNTLHRLSSITIGLIGFGKIARQVNEYLQVFGCRVLGYDPFVDEATMNAANVKKTTLEDIQTNADYISLHLPSNEQTRDMINLNFLSSCKKRPILINCSRGDIILESDLKAALDNQYISGLGLDVLSDEDPNLSDYDFLNYDEVIITPHVAFYSQESIQEADETAGYNLNNFYHSEKGNTNWL